MDTIGTQKSANGTPALLPHYREYLRACDETAKRFTRVSRVREKRYDNRNAKPSRASLDFETRFDAWACEPRTTAAQGLLNVPGASLADTAIKLRVLIGENLVCPFNEGSGAERGLRRLDAEIATLLSASEAA